MGKLTKKQLNLVIASLSGNILEWYDFALYGYFASVFSKIFFPSDNEFISLMMTFMVFASGFLVRPFGGAVFGYIGDRYGRRLALLSSIAIITIPTFLMGLLPTYKQIGIFSPIFLTTLRLLQGLSASGELSGSGIFLVECAKEKNRGLYASLVMCSTYVGLLIGCVISMFSILYFSHSELISFGWRIPFLLSILFGLPALYLRLNCEESPLYLKEVNTNNIKSNPFKYLISNHLSQVMQIILLASSLAVAIYMVIGYLPTYFVSHLGMSLKSSLIISSFGLSFLVIFVTLWGFLSQRFISARAIFYFGSSGMALSSYLIFYLIAEQNIISGIIGEFILVFFLAPIASSIIFLISDAFPTNVRFIGGSVGYNLSMTIFGGTAPLIAIFLTGFFGSNTAPAFYLILVSIASLIAAWCGSKKINYLSNDRNADFMIR